MWGGDDISSDVITHGMRFSMFICIRPRSRFALIRENLTAQATGELEVEFKFHGRSGKLFFLFPPAGTAPRRASSQAN